MVSRETWQIDLLILIGLLLLGYGLWLRFGLATLAMYAGSVAIVIGIMLASDRRRVAK
jgi:hypothetical protein